MPGPFCAFAFSAIFSFFSLFCFVKHRYHMIPTLLYNWITNLVKSWNQLWEFSHSDKQNNPLDTPNIAKLFIHNHHSVHEKRCVYSAPFYKLCRYILFSTFNITLNLNSYMHLNMVLNLNGWGRFILWLEKQDVMPRKSILIRAIIIIWPWLTTH